MKDKLESRSELQRNGDRYDPLQRDESHTASDVVLFVDEILFSLSQLQGRAHDVMTQCPLLLPKTGTARLLAHA